MGRQRFNGASWACSSKSTYASFMVFPIHSHGPFQCPNDDPHAQKRTSHLFNLNPRDRPKHANGREHANSSVFQFHCPSSIKVLLGAVTWGGWIFGGLFGMTTTARVMGRVASAVANGVPEKEWITGTNLLVLWKKMTSWQMFFCVAVWWFNNRLKLLIDTTRGPWLSRRM